MPGEDPGVAAQYTLAVYSGTPNVASEDVTFYSESISSSGYPNWDQSASNYHTFVQQIMVHEIGHGMGITDQPLDSSNPNCGGQTAGESVMNGQCGTNDSAMNLPPLMLGVPSCDNASVW